MPDSRFQLAGKSKPPITSIQFREFAPPVPRQRNRFEFGSYFDLLVTQDLQHAKSRRMEDA